MYMVLMDEEEAGHLAHYEQQDANEFFIFMLDGIHKKVDKDAHKPHSQVGVPMQHSFNVNPYNGNRFLYSNSMALIWSPHFMMNPFALAFGSFLKMLKLI